MNYRKQPTSPEVWAVIRARHTDLVVFGSFSDPDGSFRGSGEGCMETSYGFTGSDYPIIEARTTWTIDPEKSWRRIDEKHEYWLCLPIKDKED